MTSQITSPYSNLPQMAHVLAPGALVPPESTAAIAGADADNPDLITGGSSLVTPQSLLAYCQMMTEGIDSQMNAIFNQEEHQNQDATALSSLESSLNQLSNGFNDQTDLNTLNTAYADAIQAVGAGTQLGAELTADKNNILNAGSDTNVSSTDIANMVSDIKNFASNVSTDSQLDMVQLQSLESESQNATEVGSNTLQMQYQTIANTIGNFKS